MFGTSDFRILGTVCTDAVVTYTKGKSKRPIARFAIATKVSFSHQGRCRFPIVAFDDVAKKAQSVCRVGAKVAVTGTLVSEDAVDKSTGDVYVRTFFYAFEIMCIAKAKQVSLSAYEKRFSELIELAPIDPIDANKRLR